KAGVAAVRGYLVALRDAARQRYDAGMSYKEAALDIALDVYDDWGDRERIVVNCATLYREFGMADNPEIAELFAGMAEYAKARS
ncbi:MAG: MBL fold metallo-hydrolase, partial [Alphaproteobacteria bacterium]|nr:MBL fold metallo-hydrolase [Alphaproteobacteria bacterium]